MPHVSTAPWALELCDYKGLHVVSSCGIFGQQYSNSLNHFLSVLLSSLKTNVLVGIYRTAVFHQSCVHLWLNTVSAFLVAVLISTVPSQILEGCPFHYWLACVLCHIFLKSQWRHPVLPLNFIFICFMAHFISQYFFPPVFSKFYLFWHLCGTFCTKTWEEVGKITGILLFCIFLYTARTII